MLRILILVEGETEETFVNAVLAPHLFTRGFAAVSAKLMGNARLRSRRGGVRGWPEVQAGNPAPPPDGSADLRNDDG